MRAPRICRVVHLETFDPKVSAGRKGVVISNTSPRPRRLVVVASCGDGHDTLSRRDPCTACALLRRGFGHNAVLEIRMRSWADNNAEATRALREIDRRRRDYS